MTWDKKERRHRSGTDPVTLDDLDEALEMHAQAERVYVKELIDGVLKAFPDGDVPGHYEYHQKKRQALQAEEEFWKVAKLTLVQAGVNGAIKLVWVILLLAALGLTAKFAMPEAVSKFFLSFLIK